MPSKRKKKWGKKSEKSGEERKRKVKVKTAVSLWNPKILKILLSAYAQTSQANILHLNQRPQSARPVNSFVVSFSSL